MIGLDIIRAFAWFKNHLISATFHCGGMKHNRSIVLYKYVRKVNPFSGRFFSNVAVIKSYPGLCLGFDEFITDLILKIS